MRIAEKKIKEALNAATLTKHLVGHKHEAVAVHDPNARLEGVLASSKDGDEAILYVDGSWKKIRKKNYARAAK